VNLSTGLDARLTRIIGWIAYTVATTLAVATPAFYAYYRVSLEQGVLRTGVELTAEAITQRINANPEMWRFELVRLNHLLRHPTSSRVDPDERRAIFDSARRPVASYEPGEPLRRPLLRAEALLYDSGAVAGYYVVERSAYDIVRQTIVLGGIALALAALAVTALRVLPLRALRRAERDLAHLAHHDILTGLPNRASFHARLSHAIARAQRTGREIGLLFLDVDRFKLINDSLGHSIGDRVLQMVGERLRSAVRAVDSVARIGGDEFVVVVEDVQRVDDLATIARALLRRFDDPFPLDGSGVRLTCSIGIAIYPRDATDPARLLRAADLAMYDAKQQGRNSLRFSTAEMNRRADERLRLEQSLRRAVDNGEFRLVYQPQCDASGMSVVGMEALLRWHPPGEDMRLPSHFIEVLEDTGLVLPVGEWILRTACGETKAWLDRGARVKVSVNVSPVQFHAEGIVRDVRRALEATGLPADALVLEITERLLMEDSENGLGKIQALREMGVHVAVDDFGTGYSSFRYLGRFAISALKIDRSFVQDLETDPRTAILVGAIVDLAHKLGLSVTAEGVETGAQLALLRDLRCDAIQGYVFSRPLEPEAASAFVFAREAVDVAAPSA
jgi:diguanylate cyclase (GGDEF)-like protein